MLAATVYGLYKNGAVFSVSHLNYLAVGFLTSFIVALASIKFLIRFVRNHTLILFGIYRIALVLVWFAIF
ncbi:MAG: undecaprenyl-diphosphate phosphatase [Syntrophales bacterium]